MTPNLPREPRGSESSTEDRKEQRHEYRRMIPNPRWQAAMKTSADYLPPEPLSSQIEGLCFMVLLIVGVAVAMWL